jgi:molecular chaperone DnaK (HSP70)
MTKPLTGYEKEIAILHAEARLDAELIEEFKGKAHEYKQAIERVRELIQEYWEKDFISLFVYLELMKVLNGKNNEA